MRAVYLSGFALAAVAGAVSIGASADPAPQAIAITITDKGCQPAALDVPPVKVSFKIKNESRRAVEWEIIKDNMVVEERENILPGFTSTLTAKLAPNEYEMTCGLLSNPKGKLTVNAGSESAK